MKSIKHEVARKILDHRTKDPHDDVHCLAVTLAEQVLDPDEPQHGLAIEEAAGWTREERKRLWNWARGWKADAERRIQKLESKLDRIRSDAARFAEIEKLCLPKPCGACKGHGKIREWLAQDESRVLTCEACKGHGEL